MIHKIDSELPKIVRQVRQVLIDWGCAEGFVPLQYHSQYHSRLLVADQDHATAAWVHELQSRHLTAIPKSSKQP